MKIKKLHVVIILIVIALVISVVVFLITNLILMAKSEKGTSEAILNICVSLMSVIVASMSLVFAIYITLSKQA